MDPKSLRELLPDFEAQGAPIESAVEEDLMYFMTRDEAVPVPFLPPSLRQHGNLIISLGQLVRWLGKAAEALGINVFPGFPAVDALVEKDQVVGVRTGDKGVDKHGQRKANFEAGVDIKAKVTIVGEGPRGSLTRILSDRFKLTDVVLDTARVVVGRTCHFRGTLVFRVPSDTLPVTWIGYPEQALVYGWPAALGPFAGIGATRVGDSLVGAILFDSRLGVKARPGATARFVAGRARE
jgi:flavin-dependent dehydrogenase